MECLANAAGLRVATEEADAIPTGARGSPERVEALWKAGLLLAALAACEAVSDLWLPLVGILLHVGFTGFLLVHGSRQADPRRRRFYLAASILPLVRVVTFAISPNWFPGVWYYVVAEAPLMVAGISTARWLGLSSGYVGLRLPRHPELTVVTVLSGIIGGWIEYHILRPVSGASPSVLDLARIWFPGLLLVVSTGFVEEYLFRGVLQPVAIEWLGSWAGIVFTSLGWGLLHMGWDSALDVLFAMAVGLLWGWLREADGTILGTTLAHGLDNVGLLLVARFIP